MKVSSLMVYRYVGVTAKLKEPYLLTTAVSECINLTRASVVCVCVHVVCERTTRFNATILK